MHSVYGALAWDDYELLYGALALDDYELLWDSISEDKAKSDEQGQGILPANSPPEHPLK